MLAEVERSMTENASGETPPITWDRFGSFATERDFRAAIEKRATELGLRVTWSVWAPSIIDTMKHPGRGHGLIFRWEPVRAL